MRAVPKLADRPHGRVQRAGARGGHADRGGRARAGRCCPDRADGALRRREGGCAARAPRADRCGGSQDRPSNAGGASARRAPDTRLPRAPAPTKLDLRARGWRGGGREGHAARFGGHLRARRPCALSVHSAHERAPGQRCRCAAHRVRDASCEGWPGRCGPSSSGEDSGRDRGVHGGRRASHRRAGLRHRDHQPRVQDNRPGQCVRGGCEEDRVGRCGHRHDSGAFRGVRGGRRHGRAVVGGHRPDGAGRA